MRKKLRKIWEWEGIDYFIQIAGICLFASAFFHFHGANQTLQVEGCSTYWEEYKNVNVSNVKLVNSSEKAALGERQTPDPDNYEESNQSLNFTK